jgi:hypothetical protein
MRADEEINENELKDYIAECDSEIDRLESIIANHEMDMAKRQQKSFDIEAIKDRLNTYIDLKGYKVSDEMIDLFVERVIYRGIVDGNDEFLWIMNLSGTGIDASAKYRISGYSKEYSDFLKDDKNFNIVERRIISLEECERYCREEANRMYKSRFWRPITLKIAIEL